MVKVPLLMVVRPRYVFPPAWLNMTWAPPSLVRLWPPAVSLIVLVMLREPAVAPIVVSLSSSMLPAQVLLPAMLSSPRWFRYPHAWT